MVSIVPEEFWVLAVFSSSVPKLNYVKIKLFAITIALPLI